MRLFKCLLLERKSLNPKVVKDSREILSHRSFGLIVLLLVNSFLLVSVSSLPDVRESHLLPSHWTNGPSTEIKDVEEGKSGAQLNTREQRSYSQTYMKRRERSEKQIFRLELLRQIKAIDHMKCFPKVLCGLSVDSDKSFGINKSNFVRSYLELMRNIKRPERPTLGGGLAEERLRTEDEIEKELIWPYSPHNPERKHHSSFERVMSGSVELADHDSSFEYPSRGMDSRNVDGSMSVENEKIDRMGVVADSVESKEEKSPPVITKNNRMENSKIPGEKKNKKNANKSLTAKITSYFTSWLPEIQIPGFTITKSKQAESSETTVDIEDQRRMARKVNDDDDAITISPELLSSLPEIIDYLMTTPLRPKRKGRAGDEATSSGTNDGVSRDDLHGDTDIYHTAVNIGKRLKDPKQCDYIYNGCPLEYSRILDMISSIKTEIHPHEDTAEIVSQELGLNHDVIPTTTTTTTTTKKPLRKKPRPSTKIMHVLPNGEKVEINFRLGGSEDSEESSSSAQREYIGKKENTDDETSSERDENSGEVVVLDLGQRTSLTSTEEVVSNEKKPTLTSRRGSPVDTAIIKNKLSSSAKKKLGFYPSKKTEEVREKSEELESANNQEIHEIIPSQQQLQKPKPTLKLSGLTLTTNNNDDQPLEISPSYVIIKHQPLSVHTTSVLSPDNISQSQKHSSIHPHEKLQTFQLVQNGQQIDPDQITDQLKNYIRQSGGLIPKLSLHSSGLITTDPAETLPITQTSYGSYALNQASSSPDQTIHAPNSNPFAGFKLEASALAGALSKLASSTQASLSNEPFAFAHYPYSYHSVYSNGPEMVGSVPGRLDSIIKPKPSTTTPSTTTSSTTTTTEKIILPGMQETVTLDTEEMTDDTMKKLESDNSVPGWISKTSDQESAESRESESEEDDEQTILENLNKTLLSENKSGSKIRYKNPKKKRTRVKANSSRVRASLNKDGNKGTKRRGSVNTRYTPNTSGSIETDASAERVVIKHAGPYSSPTLYKSPLKGPGPHGGAYPYLMSKPSVFPGYPPFWRMRK